MNGLQNIWCHRVQMPGKCTPEGTLSAMIDSKVTSCTHSSQRFSFTRSTLQPGPCGHTTVPAQAGAHHRLCREDGASISSALVCGTLSQPCNAYIYTATWWLFDASLKKTDVLFPPMQFPPLQGVLMNIHLREASPRHQQSTVFQVLEGSLWWTTSHKYLWVSLNTIPAPLVFFFFFFIILPFPQTRTLHQIYQDRRRNSVVDAAVRLGSPKAKFKKITTSTSSHRLSSCCLRTRALALLLGLPASAAPDWCLWACSFSTFPGEDYSSSAPCSSFEWQANLKD